MRHDGDIFASQPLINGHVAPVDNKFIAPAPSADADDFRMRLLTYDDDRAPLSGAFADDLLRMSDKGTGTVLNADAAPLTLIINRFSRPVRAQDKGGSVRDFRNAFDALYAPPFHRCRH